VFQPFLRFYTAALSAIPRSASPTCFNPS